MPSLTGDWERIGLVAVHPGMSSTYPDVQTFRLKIPLPIIIRRLGTSLIPCKDILGSGFNHFI